MILHIVIDEKFIDTAYRIFEQVNPNNNIFLLVGENKELTYIKKTPVKIIPIHEFLSKRFVQSLKKYDMIIFHWMNDLNLRLIVKIPRNIKLVWFGGGADYYDLITNGDKNKLLKPLTQSLMESNFKPSSFRQKIKKIIHGLILKIIINRIDYFAPVLYEDFELIKKQIPGFKPRYISWNYGTLEDDIIRGFENHTFSGNNILIGNSATYENNHLDAFKNLSTINLEDRLIITPLSYGDPIYRDRIILFGKQEWKAQFIPVVDFMPIDDYVNIIKSCSIVIMNHIRQQGVGNIITGMHLGAKIFLDKNNPVYHFFKKKGAYIFIIDELEKEIDTQLNKKQIEHNRDIIRKHWGREVIYLKTRNLITTVLEK